MLQKKNSTDTSIFAIHVKNVSKTFRIPHEKVNSLRGAAISAFKKRSYEEFKALDNVSFDIKKGEFFGVIGRNGSGKSTLLKILAGIYKPDKGKVKINGMISPFLELGIGFNPELSGRDNVYLNATVLGMSKKQIDEKFDDIVRFSELERFIDQKLKNYSSGMQVRLAFSVSIHANRDILLMDEVLAVGDSNFQSKCLEEFNKYREMGRTVVIVTHDIGVVQRYCDRALLLRNGRIEKIGSAEDVANQYIHDNIADEEKRMMSGEGDKKMTQNDKEVQKAVEITDVKFFDGNGKEKKVFETGDDLSVRVYFKKNREVPIINFGLAILNQENICLFGINTFNDRVSTSVMNENCYFQLDFLQVLLRENVYFIQAGIWGDVVSKNYDFLVKSKNFKFVTKNKNIGLVELDYKWV